MSRIRFGILGGDFRYKILYELLKKDGYSVCAYCSKYIENGCGSIDKMIEDSEIVIGPIPTTRDSKNLALNDCDNVETEYFFDLLFKKGISLYIGGVVDKSVRYMAESRGIHIYDFFQLEEVAVKNAIPTAEGAIQTAMQESIKTLFGSKALVLGYGRCGKILANMLKGIGSHVTVTYRKEKDAAYIKAYGYEGFNINEIHSYISGFDFVFNTVPAEILTCDVLKKMNRQTIIIDLAQAPGGTDFNFARDLNIKALYCPGLPGRVAPFTAAEILKEAVLNISLSHFTS